MIRGHLLGALLLLPLVACAPRAALEPSASEPELSGSELELGRVIVETSCARCHAIEAGRASPHPAAPPFPALARRLPPDALLPLLESGVRSVHPDMPEIRLAPREIDPFLAFWATL